ncbi:MAG: DUF2905 domain-containing protein [Acidobacteria bacterium]|nr:DUF2905 domain-containing protein [Acidobacteriota bacterium]
MRRRRRPSSWRTSSAAWSCASTTVGPVLVVLGAVIAAVGALVWLGVPLGRLPGDIAIERDGVRIYIPLTTSIVVSVAFMLVSWLFRR